MTIFNQTEDKRKVADQAKGYTTSVLMIGKNVYISVLCLIRSTLKGIVLVLMNK